MDHFARIHALFVLLDRAPIVGRRRLQKIACLAGLPFRFEFGDRGPYSYDLDAVTDRLVGEGLIATEATPEGTAYRLTDRGRRFFARLTADGYRFEPAEDVAALARLSPDRLEALATLEHFMRLGLSEDEAKKKIEALRPALKAVL
ncbi:MAG: hypothetical protein HSCHL_0208 [Hydrogenibacillus schlegelii]|uniref:PadR family transcriptional regulator n=1 Tax=Hydrogenibacillus schlegelii TaxID=1484 RepID=A0A2T5G3J5_HYDSH|nr:hypothetical protein [Hydrogenibacillus schlegelii]PTQ50756.1 MAG: hypothetical protein HSCHL_0208 [Hydrogenibacillus schlegelii]